MIPKVQCEIVMTMIWKLKSFDIKIDDNNFGMYILYITPD